jgi:hypothetical protein
LPAEKRPLSFDTKYFSCLPGCLPRDGIQKKILCLATKKTIYDMNLRFFAAAKLNVFDNFLAFAKSVSFDVFGFCQKFLRHALSLTLKDTFLPFKITSILPFKITSFCPYHMTYFYPYFL